MIFKWVRDALSATQVTKAESVLHTPSVVRAEPVVPTIYPPNDPGLPLWPVEKLVEGNSQLVQRLRLHAATDVAKFQLRFLAPIERLAAHINSLPATASDLYAGEGGLLRASIELAFLSFQASDGRIFTGSSTVEVRHKLEPRWRYVCFAAGFLYAVGKPLSNMTVTNRGGEAWTKHKGPVSEWADARAVGRLYVSWGAERSAISGNDIGPAPYTSSLVHAIIGSDNLEWLEQGSPDLTKALYEIVTGQDAPALIAGQLVRVMWGKAQERERSRLPQNYGRLTVGTHLTPYLVGAMRTLVETQQWRPNVAPCIVDAKGIYLMWPEAAEDVARQATAQGGAGVPTSPAVLAELMKGAGLFDMSSANDLGYTEIVDASSGEIRTGFKLTNPNAVMPEYDPADFASVAPKTLVGVLAADPLARMEAVEPQEPVKQPEVAVRPAAPEPARKSNPVADEGEPDTGAPEDSDTDLGEGAAAEPSPPPAAALHRPAAPPPVTPDGRSVKEGADVKFSDLVPDEVRKDMKTALSVELLGKVLKGWRERGEASTTMRMTDAGAAIAYDYLSSIVRRPPDWINEVAEAGLIYSPPATPGLKVLKVAIPEGAKPREAIVISRYGCRKLGL